jgi:hypothetical protein
MMEHSITFSIKKPRKPYWELLGSKTEKEFLDKQHWHYKTFEGDFCLTCGDVKITECKLFNATCPPSE